MIVILEYGGGNVTSVRNALQKLGQPCMLSRDPAALAAARGVIMPGQGRADQAAADLSRSGAMQALRTLRVPFLGICVGMQLLARGSDEADAEGLGIIDGWCRRLPAGRRSPHMGWNRVHLRRPSPLTAGLDEGAHFYFAHSYYVAHSGPALVGHARYGIRLPAIVQHGNYHGIQFHAEKSAAPGMRLLRNFCDLCS